jgi:hypothetical protein
MFLHGERSEHLTAIFPGFPEWLDERSNPAPANYHAPAIRTGQEIAALEAEAFPRRRLSRARFVERML